MQDVRRMGVHGDLPDMSGGSRCQPIKRGASKTPSARSVKALRQRPLRRLMTITWMAGIALDTLRDYVQSAYIGRVGYGLTMDKKRC